MLLKALDKSSGKKQQSSGGIKGSSKMHAAEWTVALQPPLTPTPGGGECVGGFMPDDPGEAFRC